MKKTKLSILITIILMIMLSSTVAIVIWTSGNTNVNLSISGLDAYINYTKGTDVLTGNLTAGIDYTTGISTEIELWKSPLAENREIYGHIYLDIKELGTNLKEEPALKWAIVSNDEIIDNGNFIEREVGDTVSLVVNIPLSTEKETYTVYIWLDAMYDINKDISGETLSAKIRAEATEETIKYVVNAPYEPVIDKTPGVLTGTGTESDPYLIECIEDLITFSNNVNNWNVYTNKYVSLNQTLNFDYEGSYVDSENTSMFGDYNHDGIIEGIKKEVTTGQGFIPIGLTVSSQGGSYFAGFFRGNDNAIMNLYINYDEETSSYYCNYVGLFGFAREGTIDGLTVTGKVTGNIIGEKGDSLIYVGGIVAGAHNNATVANSVNYVEVSGYGINPSNVYVGGISAHGVNSLFDSCINHGKIAGTSIGFSSVGGIVGYSTKKSEIQNCINTVTGNITSISETSTAAPGGIAGYNNSSTINNSYNYGKISGKSLSGNIQIGGITGYNWSQSSSALIEKSVNYGSVTVNSETSTKNVTIGGIAGYNSSGQINKTINYGKINTSSVNGAIASGGIVGYNIGNVSESTNESLSSVYGFSSSGTANIGGITGLNSTGSFVTSCYNKANVEGKSINSTARIGGLVGRNYSATVSNSYNIGKVSGSGATETSGIGGIVGNNYDSASIVTNSYSLNTTSSQISGYGDSTSITNSSSKTMEEMKTSTFVNLLNQGLETPVWLPDTNNINNGYPILSFLNE